MAKDWTQEEAARIDAEDAANNVVNLRETITAAQYWQTQAADELERLRREIDIAWAAGLFEGEGCITGSQKYRSQTNEDGSRRKSGFRWTLHLNSTDFDVLRKFAKIVEVEHFYGPYKDKRGDHYKPQLSWITSTLEEAQSVLKLLLPYLGERRAAKARECLDAEYSRKRPDKAA